MATAHHASVFQDWQSNFINEAILIESISFAHGIIKRYEGLKWSEVQNVVTVGSVQTFGGFKNRCQRWDASIQTSASRFDSCGIVLE